MKKELTRYYRSISRYLPIKNAQRQQILEQIRHSVENYLGEHPEADMAALTAHFGTPQEIAASYVENMTPEEILKKFRIRRTVLIVICSVVVVAFLIWATGLIITLIHANQRIDGFGVMGAAEEINAPTYNFTEEIQ